MLVRTGIGGRLCVVEHRDAHLVGGGCSAGAVVDRPTEHVGPDAEVAHRARRRVRAGDGACAAHEAPRSHGGCHGGVRSQRRTVGREAQLLVGAGIGRRLRRVERGNGDLVRCGSAGQVIDRPGEHVRALRKPRYLGGGRARVGEGAAAAHDRPGALHLAEWQRGRQGRGGPTDGLIGPRVRRGQRRGHVDHVTVGVGAAEHAGIILHGHGEQEVAHLVRCPTERTRGPWQAVRGERSPRNALVPGHGHEVRGIRIGRGDVETERGPRAHVVGELSRTVHSAGRGEVVVARHDGELDVARVGPDLYPVPELTHQHGDHRELLDARHEGDGAGLGVDLHAVATTRGDDGLQEAVAVGIVEHVPIGPACRGQREHQGVTFHVAHAVVVGHRLAHAAEHRGVVQEVGRVVADAQGVVQRGVQVQALVAGVLQGGDGVVPATELPLDVPIGPATRPGGQVDDGRIPVALHAILTVVVQAGVQRSDADRRDDVHTVQGEAGAEARSAL